MNILKSFFLVFLLFFGVNVSASNSHFSDFISKQIEIIDKMNDANVTGEQIEALLEVQKNLYTAEFNKIMADKTGYIKNAQQYDNKIFSLKKIIAVNKRAGNRYAVVRDEVLLKSYLILQSQSNMFKSILLSLDAETLHAFEAEVNKYTLQNQSEIQKISEKNYDDILSLHSSSKILKAAQENIRDFQALLNVNIDLIGYIYKFKEKLYRLDKYAKYHLVSVALFIDSFSAVKAINPILEDYNLNMIKLLFMITIVFLIYFFRKVVYGILEAQINKIAVLQDYSIDISKKIRPSLESLMIIININIIVYIYNDFSAYENITKVFNMIYGFYFTLIIFKIVNTVAAIKLKKSQGHKSATVKNDLINVGLKIINFVIVIIGLLIVLFFAGVNLTAVLSGLGIGGFAVAFAAKDTISNFFGTLSILFSDVFSQGDWIEIGGEQGVVVEIGLRVTTIRTFDNALIAIPNGTFASKDVKNWNKRILGRRIKMHLGVKYDSKKADIKAVVEAIREMLDKHPGIATKATKYTHSNYSSAKLVSKDDLEGVKNNMLVYLDEFSDSSINILVYCFSKSVVWSEWLETKEDVMYKIMSILEENNIEFAFPSLSIYNEKMEK